MTRIDFHNVDFSKIEILDNYNYHTEDYHSYNLEFRVQEYPKHRFLVCISIWNKEWRIGRIAQMHHEKYYILDNDLKEKFKKGLKKVLALS